jgi:hypothetical protein
LTVAIAPPSSWTPAQLAERERLLRIALFGSIDELNDPAYRRDCERWRAAIDRPRRAT